MPPKKYPLLSLREFEKILNTFKIVKRRTKGGHVILTIETSEEKNTTIVYQTHKNPVPLHVIKNTIKNLKISSQEFYGRLKGKR